MSSWLPSSQLPPEEGWYQRRYPDGRLAYGYFSYETGWSYGYFTTPLPISPTPGGDVAEWRVWQRFKVGDRVICTDGTIPPSPREVALVSPDGTMIGFPEHKRPEWKAHRFELAPRFAPVQRAGAKRKTGALPRRKLLLT
jgi:hypothetical protein